MQIVVTKRSQVQEVVKKRVGSKSCWFFVYQEHNILNNTIARELFFFFLISTIAREPRLFCFLFVRDRVAMPRTEAKLVANWMGTLEVATFGRPFLCLRGFTLELLK